MTTRPFSRRTRYTSLDLYGQPITKGLLEAFLEEVPDDDAEITVRREEPMRGEPGIPKTTITATWTEGADQ
jgi:hypothetical protein